MITAFSVVYLKKSMSLQNTEELNPGKQKLFAILDNIYSNTEKVVNKSPGKHKKVIDEDSIIESKENTGISLK